VRQKKHLAEPGPQLRDKGHNHSKMAVSQEVFTSKESKTGSRPDFGGGVQAASVRRRSQTHGAPNFKVSLGRKPNHVR